MKKHLLHGITASAFAALAGNIYNYLYNEAMFTDFSAVINSGSIIGAVTFGCMLASLGYYVMSRIIKKGLDVVFNIMFILLSFASFISSFAVELPLDIDAPELFIGLSIPLHLFPIVFWLATKPLFSFD